MDYTQVRELKRSSINHLQSLITSVLLQYYLSEKAYENMVFNVTQFTGDINLTFFRLL
jgi:hypothetical protein